MLQFSSEWGVAGGNRTRVGGREKGNEEQQQESEVAIELKRSNSPSSVKLRVTLAPQGVVASTGPVQGAAMGDETREEREAHLEEPSALENKAEAEAQSGEMGEGRSDVEESAEEAEGYGEEEEVVVAILDAGGVFALKVEKEEL